MQGSLDAPPIIIRARRWYPQMTWLVALLALALASQAFMFLTPGVKAPASAYVAGPFVGLMLILLLLRVVWPGRMEIGPDGVVVRALLRNRRRTWAEAFAFRPVRYRGIEFIVYDIPAGARAGSALGRAVARSSGADGLLAGNMELGADDLAQLLNQARARWTAEAAAPTPLGAVSPGVRAWSAYLTLVSGRLSRRAYWIGTALVATVVVAAGLTTKVGPVVFVFALLAWSFVARCRIRDLGHAPAWLALFLVPPIVAFTLISLIGSALVGGSDPSVLFFLGFFVTGLVVLGQIILLGALPGQPGHNRYGPSPLGADPAIDAIFS